MALWCFEQWLQHSNDRSQSPFDLFILPLYNLLLLEDRLQLEIWLLRGQFEHSPLERLDLVSSPFPDSPLSGPVILSLLVQLLRRQTCYTSGCRSRTTLIVCGSRRRKRRRSHGRSIVEGRRGRRSSGSSRVVGVRRHCTLRKVRKEGIVADHVIIRPTNRLPRMLLHFLVPTVGNGFSFALCGL